MSSSTHPDQEPASRGPTPYLLGRPALFEIIEMDQPEQGTAFRWLVSFYVQDAPNLIFELKEGTETLPSPALGNPRCYELLENGEPCGLGRWHFGPDTARSSIVATVESHVQAMLQRPSAHRAGEGVRHSRRHLPVGFLHTLSLPGIEVLNLFRARQSAPQS